MDLFRAIFGEEFTIRMEQNLSELAKAQWLVTIDRELNQLGLRMSGELSTRVQEAMDAVIVIWREPPIPQSLLRRVELLHLLLGELTTGLFREVFLPTFNPLDPNIAEELVLLAQVGNRPQFDELASCYMARERIPECWAGARARLRLEV